MSEFYFPAFDDMGLDRAEQALCEYFMRLRCIVENASVEFDYVFTTWDELQRLRVAIGDEFDAMVATATKHIQFEGNAADTRVSDATLPLVYSPGLGAAEIREQSMLLRAESSAGALILMMDDAIQRLRLSVWDDAAEAPYPSDFTLGRLSGSRGHVATAIYAGGNAYRHAKDWIGLVDEKGVVNQAHSHFRHAGRTISILRRLVGTLPIYANSICIDVLRAVSSRSAGSPDFGTLWDGSLTDVGRDFASRYCGNADAFGRVAEAIQYQDNVSSIEASYTMNPLLFGSAEADDGAEGPDRSETRL